MIDLHAHILPKIDDGPYDIVESLEMLKIARMDGITKITATPHVFASLDEEQSNLIIGKYGELVKAAAESGLDIEIHMAAEIFITPDFKSNLKFRPGTYDGNGRFALVEFSLIDLPYGYEAMLANILQAGVKPIIAHPERNRKVSKDLRHARNMVDSGGLLQVTAGSIMGGFGPGPRKTAIELLESDMIFVVSSDAHDSAFRPPVLSEAYKFISHIAGEEMADELIKNNPEMVLSAKRHMTVDPSTCH